MSSNINSTPITHNFSPSVYNASNQKNENKITSELKSVRNTGDNSIMNTTNSINILDYIKNSCSDDSIRAPELLNNLMKDDVFKSLLVAAKETKETKETKEVTIDDMVSKMQSSSSFLEQKFTESKNNFINYVTNESTVCEKNKKEIIEQLNNMNGMRCSVALDNLQYYTVMHNEIAKNLDPSNTGMKKSFNKITNKFIKLMVKHGAHGSTESSRKVRKRFKNTYNKLANFNLPSKEISFRNDLVSILAKAVTTVNAPSDLQKMENDLLTSILSQNVENKHNGYLRCITQKSLNGRFDMLQGKLKAEALILDMLIEPSERKQNVPPLAGQDAPFFFNYIGDTRIRHGDITINYPNEHAAPLRQMSDAGTQSMGNEVPRNHEISTSTDPYDSAYSSGSSNVSEKPGFSEIDDEPDGMIAYSNAMEKTKERPEPPFAKKITQPIFGGEAKLFEVKAPYNESSDIEVDSESKQPAKNINQKGLDKWGRYSYLNRDYMIGGSGSFVRK